MSVDCRHNTDIVMDETLFCATVPEQKVRMDRLYQESVAALPSLYLFAQPLGKAFTRPMTVNLSFSSERHV
jgi:hypothetical protein